MKKEQDKGPLALDGVNLKVLRADDHANHLHQSVADTLGDAGYATIPEIYDGGRKHVYRAIDPPQIDPMFGTILGDWAHNMRSALDHLAFQLVRLNGRQPTIGTTFPIRNSPPRRHTWFSRKRELPDIAPGVSESIRQLLDSVQPYRRPEWTHGLDILRDLNNVDKHRELAVVVGTALGHVSSHWGESAEDGNPPIPRTRFTRKPLKDGEIFAILTYDPPYPTPDPNLKFNLFATFGVGSPLLKRLRGDPVFLVMDDLDIHVKDDVLPLFQPLFDKPG